jgi:hypothetical protein
VALKDLGQKLGGILIGIAGFCVVGIVVSIFFYGFLWIASKLLPIVEVLGTIGTLLLVPLLIVSIFRRARNFCGNGIILVTYIWGAALWMWATLVLYELWGGFGLVVGLLLFGFGSVPMACVAMLFHGEFAGLGMTILAVVILFAVRALGVWIIGKASVEAGSI